VKPSRTKGPCGLTGSSAPGLSGHILYGSLGMHCSTDDTLSLSPHPCLLADDCRRFAGNTTNWWPAAIARGIHPFPSRTRPLSPAARMVLPGQPGGRVRRCRPQSMNPPGPDPADRGGSFVPPSHEHPRLRTHGTLGSTRRCAPPTPPTHRHRCGSSGPAHPPGGS
jgi:hypothetical protein